MADLKISQMTLDATPVGTDVLPIVSGGVNYKAALNTLGTAIGNISQSQIVSNQILASFTNTASIQEFGATLNTLTLNWTYNRTPDPTSQTIDSGVGAVAVNLRTKALTAQGLTNSHTYNISAVGDDSTNSTLGTTVSFEWKRYWGPSATDVLTGANVMSVLNPLGNEFGTSKGASKSFTAGATPLYYYFAYPAAWGAIAAWTFNGFTQAIGDLEYSNGSSFGATPTNISLTNSSGGTTNYYIVRSKYQYQNSTDTFSVS